MTSMIFKYSFETKFGTMTAYEQNNKLIRLGFNSAYEGIYRKTVLLEAAEYQICEYIFGKRKAFDLPINPVGTPFQTKVWNELLTIPYGEVRSYQDVAASCGNINAARAVGSANNKNPIMIIIPCHRVIGKNGAFIGYAGGINIKKQLLELEHKYK